MNRKFFISFPSYINIINCKKGCAKCFVFGNPISDNKNPQICPSSANIDKHNFQKSCKYLNFNLVLFLFYDFMLNSRINMKLFKSDSKFRGKLHTLRFIRIPSDCSSGVIISLDIDLFTGINSITVVNSTHRRDSTEFLKLTFYDTYFVTYAIHLKQFGH